MRFHAIAFGLVCCLASGLAAADEGGSFVALDRVAPRTSVGVDARLSFLDETGYNAGLAFNAYGKYVSSDGWGAYGQVLFSHAFVTGGAAGGISNIELGGLYAVDLGGASLILRLGAILPTAPTDFANIVAVGIAQESRFTDLALASPRAVWLRPSLTLRAG